MKVVKNIDELIEAIGLKKGAEVQIMTPQFERTYEIEIDFIPKTKEEIDLIISTASDENLRKMGCAVFNELPNKDLLWLFPGEWYDHIPNGYIVTGLGLSKYPFEHGKSDDDIRFGVLPYGFVRTPRKEVTNE